MFYLINGYRMRQESITGLRDPLWCSAMPVVSLTVPKECNLPKPHWSSNPRVRLQLAKLTQPSSRIARGRRMTR